MKKFIISLLSVLAFAPAMVGAVSLGTVNESIPVGKTLSIALNQSPTGNWFILNNDASIASASLSGNNLVVKGVTTGTTSFSLCTEMSATNCMSVTVKVVGSVLGLYTSAAHPAGTWVIEGKTVYYVHSTGLIPITTWAIFLSNGGKASAIVPINDGDMHLPFLSFMEPQDSRVQ